ncbi:acyltransferase family protein [Variovorax paradoxus]|uniref:acyltransferase family protein n=1 Tax=Variovorax paradoxus TaxID=34073 RepID=UPI000A6D8E46
MSTSPTFRDLPMRAPAIAANTAARAEAYRADIDGLRAVAVLAVVFFHAFPRAVPGGFIGVDVFFVISGFLITSILLRAQAEGRFSYRDFYARRVRRIFPALLLVLAAVLAFGWWVLLDDEFRTLGRQAGGGAFFVANLVFWREAGYFDAAAELKPLLHLWSLGIEEQFYLLWPVLIALSWRRRWPLLRVLWLVAIASFAINVLGIHSHRGASFYSPLSRAWELAAGGIVACLQLRPGRAPPAGWRAHLLSLAGAALIALGLATVRADKAFPGGWALLPVAGAACCIAAGGGGVLNRRLLSNRVLVWIGLLSYPLYLWHWPVLSFLRIVLPREPHELTGLAASVRVAALAASLLLAAATHGWLERRLRARAGGATVRWLGAGMVLVALAGCAVQAGLPARLHGPALQRMADAAADRDYHDGPTTGELGPFVTYRIGEGAHKVLLIGDSHVMQYAPRAAALAQRAPGRMASSYFTVFLACPPIPGVFARQGIECGARRDEGLRMALEGPFETVLVGACWNCYFTETLGLPMGFDLREGEAAYPIERREGEARALAALEGLLAALVQRGKKVYLLLDNPGGSGFDPARMLEGSRLGSLRVSREVTAPQPLSQAALNDQLLRIAAASGAKAIDVTRRMCRGGRCDRTLPDGSPAFIDEQHLRPAFTRAHADWLDEVLLRGPPP